MESRAPAEIDTNLRFEHDPVGRQSSEQPHLEVGILGLVPCRSCVENAREPAGAVTTRTSEPPTARVECRNRNQTPVDQLLEHGLEIVVVERAGEVGCEPYGSKKTDAVVSRRPIPRWQHRRAVHHDITERGTAPPSDDVDRACGHPAKAEQATGRRPADHEVGKREARRQARLFETHVVTTEPEHVLVHRDEKLPTQELSPTTTTDTSSIELVERDESMLFPGVLEHGDWNW
jgi:hypothetical protein